MKTARTNFADFVLSWSFVRIERLFYIKQRHITVKIVTMLLHAYRNSSLCYSVQLIQEIGGGKWLLQNMYRHTFGTLFHHFYSIYLKKFYSKITFCVAILGGGGFRLKRASEI